MLAILESIIADLERELDLDSEDLELGSYLSYVTY